MVTEETSGVLFEYPETEPEAVVFEDVQTVIDHYHSTMNDNEGLIEVNTGKTNNGRDYISRTVRELVLWNGCSGLPVAL